MVIVIIAGGSGTRLWPLSQGNHPKHLLSLTGDRSMLQNTYRRAKQAAEDAAHIYVVTEISHSQEVRQQLPELAEDHVVVEPGRRGTVSCFVLALAKIAQDHRPNEVVVFIHADHHIPDEDGFAKAVRAATEGSTATKSIALVGVRPNYPATGFGYIEFGDKLADYEGLPVYKVEGFKEKPPIETAKQYLLAGTYLWNQGLFAAPVRVWETEFKEYAPYYFEAYEQLRADQDDLARLSATYLALESGTIDYALIEHTPNLVVIPAQYDWADIGSFLDLHTILKDKDSHDNVLKGNVSMINCEDSMIHATDKPVIAIGLSGIIVVDTPDGLLVCAKEQSQLVGDLSKKLAKAQAEKSQSQA